MRRLLVLWDVDHTLVDSDGVGQELYGVAFREMFGRELPQPGPMGGRTDRAITLEVLTLAGVPNPRQRAGAFQAMLATWAPSVASLVRARGRALPGATRAVAALAALADAADGQQSAPSAVQTLLTGNIRELAEVKLSPFGLTEHLDLDAGAYGDAHEVRAKLVPVAWRNAAIAYGGDFDSEDTVLVGDTPFDVEAALVNGARAVAVATGSFTAEALAAAGAHAVLPDLADTGRVVSAILGRPTP
jgi:phosphoglycolate phosphatase